jgi:hypothetical protein
VIDLIVNNITKNIGCSYDEAVESFIHSICKKYEDSLISVGIERNIIKPARKMDAISVEAMLQDACFNHTNSKVFFGTCINSLAKICLNQKKNGVKYLGTMTSHQLSISTS